MYVKNDTSDVINEDRTDKEDGESAKDNVKEESQAEDLQINNEKETEAKLKQNKEDSDLKDIDKTKS